MKLVGTMLDVAMPDVLSRNVKGLNIYLRPHLTTHSTGARVSLPFIVNLDDFEVVRARLIRALGVFFDSR